MCIHVQRTCSACAVHVQYMCSACAVHVHCMCTVGALYTRHLNSVQAPRREANEALVYATKQVQLGPGLGLRYIRSALQCVLCITRCALHRRWGRTTPSRGTLTTALSTRYAGDQLPQCMHTAASRTRIERQHLPTPTMALSQSSPSPSPAAPYPVSRAPSQEPRALTSHPSPLALNLAPRQSSSPRPKRTLPLARHRATRSSSISTSPSRRLALTSQASPWCVMCSA